MPRVTFIAVEYPDMMVIYRELYQKASLSLRANRGSHLTRLREARRLQRLQRFSLPSARDDNTTAPCPPTVDKQAQNRVILELAWKTVALMHKNRLIQQKIIALKKETSEFVETVMNNPENRKRYLEHIRLHGTPQVQNQVPENKASLNIDLKI